MFDSGHSAPVQAKDVGVGTLIWYKGFTSMGDWDCPAVIYKTEEDGFYVMSLDDMKEQRQKYEIEESQYSPSSRKNMRLASTAEVDAYLASSKSRLNAKKIISRVQAAIKKVSV